MSKHIKATQPQGGNKLSKPAATVPSPDQLPPKFCLRQIRQKYCITACEKDEQAAFAQRLYELSRSKWADLRQMPKTGQGYEKITRKAIKGDKVPDSITADVDLIAFRCIGKAPMVGYRSADGVFNILWIDRDFTLYDHGS